MKLEEMKCPWVDKFCEHYVYLSPDASPCAYCKLLEDEQADPRIAGPLNWYLHFQDKAGGCKHLKELTEEEYLNMRKQL